jgi:uncharacterized protein
MKSIIRAALLSLFFTATIASGQKLPEKANPPRLVNDYANLLSETERNRLEMKLVAFNDSTSTQITVVITDDLQGLESQEYATELGNKWGVGQNGKNNGLLVLLCPKSHKLFVASGYGTEGLLPDLRIKDIEDAVMFPNFKQGNYYEGLDKGTNLMISSFKGEYKAEAPARRRGRGKNDFGGGIIVLIVVFVILFRVFASIFSKKGGSHIASKGMPWWMWLFLLNSGSSRGNSWNDFNSGSGGFGGGGGGGGFGGFGGGSFGGGGAGGSW